MIDHRRRPGPAGGDRPQARGGRRRARRRARPVRGRRRPAPRRPRAAGGRRAQGAGRARGGGRRAAAHGSRSAEPRVAEPGQRPRQPTCCAERARARPTPLLAELGRARLRQRDRRPRTARRWPTRSAPRASGCAPRWCWRRTARWAAVTRRSPAWPRRSRRCTPTRWCTTTCPAWTTTTSAAAARPPTAASTSRPPPGSASCWCRWPPGCWPAAAAELGLPAAALGRMAEELFQAGGIEGMVGGQWLDLEAERPDARRCAQLMAVHRGKTGALIRAACTLGGIAARGGARRRSRRSPPSARTSASPSRSPTTCSTAPGPARSWARRPGGTPQLAKSTYVGLLGVDGARREAERAGPAGGRAPRPGRGAVGGTGGPGGVYCEQEFVRQSRSSPCERRATRCPARMRPRCARDCRYAATHDLNDSP